MERIGLPLLIFLAVGHLCIGQSVTISGAGNATYGVYSLNGTYALNGQANGKNQYSISPGFQSNGCYNCYGNATISWTGTQWQLAASGGGQCYYCNIPTSIHSNTTVTGTNPPCTGWSNGMTLTGSCENGSAPCTSVSLVVAQAGNQTTNPASTTISIGNSLTLLATGCTGGQTLWSTGITSTSVVVTPTVTEIYAVTCTTAACASPSSQSTTVNVALLNLPAPVVGTLPASVCVGKGFTVPYSVTGVYPTDNVFSVQLSDTLGTWASPNVVGVISATASGAISSIVPDGFIRHGGYRLRVVSTTSTGVDTVGKAIAVVSLCSNATITTACNTSSVQSGDWHNPATWSCGQVPGDEDVVTISASHTVSIAANQTAVCQSLRENGKLVFRQGARLKMVADENPEGPVEIRGPVVLQSGLFMIDEASIGQILWVNGNHVRFRGTPNSISINGSPSGGRLAAPRGLIGGSFMISKSTDQLPNGFFGKVERSFTVNGTTGVETEVVFSKAEYHQLFRQLNIGWRAVVKLSAKVDLEGKVKGESTDERKVAEVSLKATANDTIRITFDFGLQIVNSTINSFSVGAAVDNNLRLSLESTGKISYEIEQLLTHWQKEKSILKWIPTGTFIQIPLVFTPRVNTYFVAEASAEYTINGELLNTHQHFSMGKRYDAGMGWSNYQLPPVPHADTQLTYSVKGTIKGGLKIKAGVFFYDQDHRDDPPEDGDDEETLDIIIEAVKGITGECANDSLSLKRFIAVKPELVLELPVLDKTLEAKLTLDLPNFGKDSTSIYSRYCQRDSSCLSPQPIFALQLKKGSQNRIESTYSTIEDKVIHYQYDTQGWPSKIIYSTGEYALFEYSGNEARLNTYTALGERISGAYDQRVFEFSNGKLSRYYDYFDEPRLKQDVHITYYPNGYPKSIHTDLYDYISGGWGVVIHNDEEYSYDETNGRREIRFDGYRLSDGGHSFETRSMTYDMEHKDYSITTYGGRQVGDELSTNIVNLLIHSDTFYQGALLKTQQWLATDVIWNIQFSYTFDSKGKPISVTQTQKWNNNPQQIFSDPIKWQPCP